MNLDDFLYSSILRGYEIMGLDQKRIDRMIQLKEAKREYQSFLDDIDVSIIEDYFKLGLKANVFRTKTNTLLSDRDNLFWRFDNKGYQYLLCRRPLNFMGRDMNSIIKEILQKGVSSE